jgi:uncharacterized membrane protein
MILARMNQKTSGFFHRMRRREVYADILVVLPIILYLLSFQILLTTATRVFSATFQLTWNDLLLYDIEASAPKCPMVTIQIMWLGITRQELASQSFRDLWSRS